jgi:hypothetical protein
VAKYEVAVVKAVENRDQFDFSSISSDINPSEKEASKLPQIMKKIANPQLAKTAGINLSVLYYRLILLLFTIDYDHF